MLCATALQSGQTTLPACAAKQVISSPWGAPLLGLPKPVADSHAKDAPRQIPSNFRTSPNPCTCCGTSNYAAAAQALRRTISRQLTAPSIRSARASISKNAMIDKAGAAWSQGKTSTCRTYGARAGRVRPLGMGIKPGHCVGALVLHRVICVLHAPRAEFAEQVVQ